ncbi:recombinase family protein [Burkholderia ambifaria]|uniref:recombinase family protein n=1 Tax=Burkholderia ambifaria TaxID=152480 RepID=UPI0028F4189C|nr:recombinase family protein [Burkholderia ambifaria]
MDRQLEYAARWAADHGMELDASLSLRDEGLSAYHQRHVRQGALGVFLRAAEDGQVPTGSVLIVEGLDRLSRAEPLQAQAQLAQIVNAGHHGCDGQRRPRLQPRAPQGSADGPCIQPTGDDPRARGIGHEE